MFLLLSIPPSLIALLFCGTFLDREQAQQARGVELGKNEHLFSRLKNSVNILLPLILTSLNRIDTISNAMELRGFGKNKKRTWYTRRPFAVRDFVALGIGVVLLVVSLIVSIK